MITLYLVKDYEDKFVGLVRTRELAKEIYSEFGDSIIEICFEDDDTE